MQRYRVILIIGIIEIFLGIITLLFNILSLLFQANPKSPGVFLFVCFTAVISTSLGLGLLLFRHWAYNLLLYFSSVIFLTKIALFLGVIELNGALVTTIPGPIKNSVSLLYHGFIVYYLLRPHIRRLYHH